MKSTTMFFWTMIAITFAILMGGLFGPPTAATRNHELKMACIQAGHILTAEGACIPKP